jgi:hypothetical protein
MWRYTRPIPAAVIRVTRVLPVSHSGRPCNRQGDSTTSRLRLIEARR